MSGQGRGIENFAFGSRGTKATLHIGLVNNMPDAAMRATELQFARLLKDAANNYDVRLHLFAMPEIARTDMQRSRMEGFYADVATLPAAGMDGLIITGAEPLTDALNDETYWPALTRLMDWSVTGTASTLFSCLAAHAAVLHFDNIPRRPLPKKISGVFASMRATDDPLLAGLPARGATPHSRKNGLLESDLTAKNYRVLSRLTDGSVDAFARDGKSHQIFFQGHPEYGAETLGREYLRDVGRFLRSEGPRPVIPENYFDRVTENALQGLAARDARIGEYHDIIMSAVPLQSWRSYTLKLFANWIAGIAAEKPRRRAPKSAAKSA
ncbi:MAG TPA: homoserine O-succinyltransferase [Rhizomicrobium sp.]|jgi:homoserine O-succinyltransferase|nr:homoserine O-succinyltransferase [Rhizomicrobium sp.]